MASDLLVSSGSPARALAMVAIAAAILALVLLAALHVLRTDLAPSWHVISEYANGPHGWVMTIVFAALATSCVATVVGLLPRVEGAGAMIGVALLGLAAAGLAMAALFPADIVQDPMPPTSWTGTMHAIAAMVGNPALIAAMLVLAYAIGGSGPWGGSSTAITLVAHLGWISFVTMMVGMFVFLPQGTGGLAGLVGYGNRLLVIAYGLWLVLVNWPLLRS